MDEAYRTARRHDAVVDPISMRGSSKLMPRSCGQGCAWFKLASFSYGSAKGAMRALSASLLSPDAPSRTTIFGNYALSGFGRVVLTCARTRYGKLSSPRAAWHTSAFALPTYARHQRRTRERAIGRHSPLARTASSRPPNLAARSSMRELVIARLPRPSPRRRPGVERYDSRRASSAPSVRASLCPRRGCNRG